MAPHRAIAAAGHPEEGRATPGRPDQRTDNEMTETLTTNCSVSPGAYPAPLVHCSRPCPPGGWPGGHGGGGLAGFGRGLFLAAAVRLRLAAGLTRLAVVIRLVRAGGVGGYFGLDAGQRVIGVLGEPGQVAGGQRDAVAGPSTCPRPIARSARRGRRARRRRAPSPGRSPGLVSPARGPVRPAAGPGTRHPRRRRAGRAVRRRSGGRRRTSVVASRPGPSPRRSASARPRAGPCGPAAP